MKTNEFKILMMAILTFSAGLFVGMFIMIVSFLPMPDEEAPKAEIFIDEETGVLYSESIENELFYVEQNETTTEQVTENKSNAQNFELTAYCPCEICCGEYAKNRPIDENGKPIVYGSTGERLTSGYSIAVDPDVIPYGSEVIIDGKLYKAQDCGGAIKGNKIDVYFDNHRDAANFGRQTKEVEIIEN